MTFRPASKVTDESNSTIYMNVMRMVSWHYRFLAWHMKDRESAKSEQDIKRARSFSSFQSSAHNQCPHKSLQPFTRSSLEKAKRFYSKRKIDF